MISIEQIVAARAFLKWTQEDLAKHSTVSIGTIKDMERGKSKNARSSTLEPIIKTFTDHGIEFIENGVRKQKSVVVELEGDEGIREFYHDVASTAEREGGEFLIYGVDEKYFVNALKRIDWHATYRARLKNAKEVSFLVLIRKSDANEFGAPHCTYRKLPDNLIKANAPFYIYGEKLALIIWTPKPKFIIISHPELAQSYREQFNYMWQQAEE